MNADERDEITASVAAHAELGSRYDIAVAEGLVERIGEEIDRRVDARLRSLGQHNTERQGYLSPFQQIVPPGYQGGQRPTQAPAGAPPSAAAATAPPPAATARHGGGAAGMVTGMFLGLGSMGLGVGATAVVVAHHVTALVALFMILLIWFAIAAINIAHSQRR